MWNKDKCQCECKEDLINKLACDKGYMWNPSTCSCECDKYCDVGQYLNYKNFVCRKRILGDLIEQCNSVVDESIMRGNKSDLDCPSQMPYVVLFMVFLLVSALLVGAFVYYFRYRSGKDKKVDYVSVNYSLTGKNNYLL